MLEALSTEFGPVLFLCLGHGEMPAVQEEGPIRIERMKTNEPNMLARAAAFGQFVAHRARRHAEALQLTVFRDPWGGAPLLQVLDSIPALFEVNALPSWELSYSYSAFRTNFPLREKVRDLERFCLRRANRILTISDVTAKALLETEPELAPPVVIPNSAHPAFFAVDPTPSERIAYFGSLHRWQGIRRAIEAFAMIAPSFPELRFDIITAGRKAERKMLRKRVRKLGLADRIQFIPAMQAGELAAHIAQCRFTLAPLIETRRNTRQGCCPIKIVESMAAGVPVVASDLRVNRALIEHDKTGILLPPHTRTWANHMRDLLGKLSKCRNLGKCARDTAKTRFSREGIHARLGAVFHETAALTMEV